MREEIIKFVYKGKNPKDKAAKIARLVGCCCKDVNRLIEEANEELKLQEQIIERFKRGKTMNLDVHLEKDERDIGIKDINIEEINIEDINTIDNTQEGVNKEIVHSRDQHPKSIFAEDTPKERIYIYIYIYILR